MDGQRDTDLQIAFPRSGEKETDRKASQQLAFAWLPLRSYGCLGRSGKILYCFLVWDWCCCFLAGRVLFDSFVDGCLGLACRSICKFLLVAGMASLAFPGARLCWKVIWQWKRKKASEHP